MHRPDVSAVHGVADASARLLAPVPVRLLGAHLDSLDAHTCAAVDGAIERLADALVDWHDALALGHAPPRRSSPGAPSTPPSPIGPAAHDGARTLADLMERDGLSAVVADCQRVHDQLRRSADTMATVIDRLRTGARTRPGTSGSTLLSGLADSGEPVHAAAVRLAGALDRFGQECADMRQRVGATGADRPVRISHGLAVLRRAESVLRTTAATTLPS